ncbi:MAG: hypothetical protein BroJett040_01960 [Oligoflexia bacterium]|nr:MAG: hypothetical protein BroJett040_01960 [Oligoflexia bacterium]
MKSLSYFELVQFGDYCKSHLLGAQLQSVLTDGHIVVFELYLQGTYFLIFDLHPTQPQVYLVEKLDFKLQKTQKPLTLFLNSHAKNKRLVEVETSPDWGRVIKWHFRAGGETQNPETEVVVEAHLIPHAVNLKAFSGGKSISWAKPKELPQSHFEQDISPAEQQPEIDWIARGQQWLQSRKGQGSVVKTVDPTLEMTRAIEKKRKALQAIEEKLNQADEESWRELGEILKYSEEIPVHLQKFYDSKLSRGQNRERAFEKAKQIIQKKQGSLERIEILKAEIESLHHQLENPQETTQVKSRESFVRPKIDLKSRKLTLENGMSAVIGKSAKDNLLLLRQARAWDLWFHLRDYPGAYAIVFREKTQELKPKEIEKIGQWLVKERLSTKQMGIGTFDVLLAECRYVKPVKGSPGLVTYRNEKTFTIKLSGS